ncbi:rta1 domain protein [Colletotrichum scovillei]|uniref:rta1 domain protein n=1 Tax=Colletotrichum scovillei TaxID=1209932 RepID=UPI0015C338BE|nr:rta1 domain protein [Colletotrichum scovillei]KAF4785630.1 rta1 domain protein [Colletotrichum scovillei]
MSADEFRESVESQGTPIDSHIPLLRIAFIYLDEALWDGRGVFDVVEQLHTRGWSFGHGDLSLNRTLDIFYLAQLAAAMYRFSDQGEGEFATADDFDGFYAQHSELLDENAWRKYYSSTLLAQPISARFYRLPDLQDLPDSSDPLAQPRHKGNGHLTKLPRWAHNVVRTHRRQPSLFVETITQIALNTLEQTIGRLREDYTDVQPYSETQARFWLKYMNIGCFGKSSKEEWNYNEFGISVAQGRFDMWAWEAHYSQERWKTVNSPYLEPDLDGTRESEVSWCGWPDGGVGEQARSRGWEPELGSEEEVAFLAAFMEKETEGIDMNDLDYGVRSHILLGVMCAALDVDEGQRLEEVKRQLVAAGRIDENRAAQWIREVLMAMKPYLRMNDGQSDYEKNRGELLRQILVEDGQLLGGWKLSDSSKGVRFWWRMDSY